MAEQPTAKGGGANQHGPFEVRGISDPAPTLASQGIDKNLAKRAIGNWVIRKPNYRGLAHCCDGCCDSPTIAPNQLSH